MHISHTAIFPSIIGNTMVSGFEFIQNPIIDWIYDYQKNDKGVIKSNSGGWQSKSNFYEEESFSSFFDPLCNAIDFYIGHTYENVSSFTFSNAWININFPGCYNRFHNHPMSEISGCFYIKVPENSGALVFQNDMQYDYAKCMNLAKSDIKVKFNYDHSFGIVPLEGSVFFFPSSLYHEVTENNSKSDRISIAFNLALVSSNSMTE